MPKPQLSIRVPINGKLLIKLDGFDTLHEVGAFTKELDVALSIVGGNVDFKFDERFFQESIEANRGVAAPTPQAAGQAAASIVQKVLLEAHNLRDHGLLASNIISALDEAGLLK